MPAAGQATVALIGGQYRLGLCPPRYSLIPPLVLSPVPQLLLALLGAAMVAALVGGGMIVTPAGWPLGSHKSP